MSSRSLCLRLFFAHEVTDYVHGKFMKIQHVARNDQDALLVLMLKSCVSVLS
jgi:hypothetical protein